MMLFPNFSSQYAELERSYFLKLKILFSSAEGVPCTKEQQMQCGMRATCIADPFLPDYPVCRCFKGFKMSKDNKCVGR